MIQATRTAFVEQPDGAIQCVVTIARADRTAALSGNPIQFAAVPGTASTPAESEAAQGFDVTMAGDPAPAETAADKPAPQTLGVGGFDSATVVDAVADGEQQWDHPAAPHMRRIFKHEPFQRYAMERLHADAFAAPMECATRFITKAVKGKPMDAAMAALAKRMNEYMTWAQAHDYPVWPEQEAHHAA